MNDLTKLNKAARERKEEKKAPPIKKCMFSGCPMKASSKDSDGYKCAFHNTSDYHYEVTESIIKHMKFIKAYSKMLFWISEDWPKNQEWLMNNAICNMEEGELHSLYIKRFYTCLSDKIQDEATVIVLKRLENQEAIESEL